MNTWEDWHGRSPSNMGMGFNPSPLAYIGLALNAADMQNVYKPGPYRPRSIDPTQKLSDQAARLLAANHCLVQS